MVDSEAFFTDRFGFRSGPVIHDDCPSTTRIGIWYAISRSIDKKWISGWQPVANEILRLNRVQDFVTDKNAWDIAKESILELRWDFVFVLCERIYSTFLQPEIEYVFNGEESEILPLEVVRKEFEKDINQVLAEENSAYRMDSGLMRSPGRKHSKKMIVQAGSILHDSRLKDARIHYSKAVKYFSDLDKKDFENSVKESVASLEAAAKALFPDLGGDLDKILQQVKDVDGEKVPPTIVKGILAPYHFRGAGKGIAHGGTNGGIANARFAEWTLSVVAAAVILLKDISESLEQEAPLF